jgi:5-methylcytosine-specific restriction enzyme subunit McrC
MNELDDAVTVVRPPAPREDAETPTDPPRDPIILAEHDETPPFPISEADGAFLETLAADIGALSISYTADGEVSIGTSSYVGVVTLPSGVRIEITPKETVSRLLDLLQYALDVPTQTVTQQTEFTEARTFIDAFGLLFATKLEELLRAGVRRDYKRVQTIEQSVRGRLDVQRQIQRSTPVPTDFAVEYDTLTPNTVLNQAILGATDILTALVSDEAIARQLDRQSKKLRRFVEPAHVQLAQLEAIELTRLDTRYEDVIELAKLVLARRFFEDITGGDLATYSLFIDMNSIYEAVVERAFRDAAHEIDPSLIVEGQGGLSELIEGPHAVDMTPDVVLKDSTGEVILVGDAKWKTGSRSPGDVYQLTSYMLADNVPGVLVYPDQNIEEYESRVIASDTTLELSSIQLPTAAEASSYEAYTSQLVNHAEAYLRNALHLTEV